MGDPLRGLLGLGDGRRQYIMDTDHVTEEDFQLAQTLTNIIWGPDGLAHYLKGSWHMVHDRRFVILERAFIEQKQHLQPVFIDGIVDKGYVTIRAGDLLGSANETADLELYAEMLGEGRHFLEACLRDGININAVVMDARVRRNLINQECPNYTRRDGVWNKEAVRLDYYLKNDLMGLVRDYAEVAYGKDWVNLNTMEVVPQGEPGDEDNPHCAVEIDNLSKALSFRAQVRMTAWKLLKRLKFDKELGDTTLTDFESDEIVQALFKAEYDKLYTVMPAILGIIQQAQALPLEQRIAMQEAKLKQESQEFIAKLKSGEEGFIVTPIMETGEIDPLQFLTMIQTHQSLGMIYTRLMHEEKKGTPGAKEHMETFVHTQGSNAPDVIEWLWTVDPRYAKKVAETVKVDAAMAAVEGIHPFDLMAYQALIKERDAIASSLREWAHDPAWSAERLQEDQARFQALQKRHDQIERLLSTEEGQAAITEMERQRQANEAAEVRMRLGEELAAIDDTLLGFSQTVGLTATGEADKLLARKQEILSLLNPHLTISTGETVP